MYRIFRATIKKQLFWCVLSIIIVVLCIREYKYSRIRLYFYTKVSFPCFTVLQCDHYWRLVKLESTDFENFYDQIETLAFDSINNNGWRIEASHIFENGGQFREEVKDGNQKNKIETEKWPGETIKYTYIWVNESEGHIPGLNFSKSSPFDDQSLHPYLLLSRTGLHHDSGELTNIWCVFIDKTSSEMAILY